jgi:lipoprotein-anchoring transpeptidase ErfK/SrfK
VGVLAIAIVAGFGAVALNRAGEPARADSAATAPTSASSTSTSVTSTSTTAASTTVAPTTTTTLDDGALRPGDHGDDVLALQRSLDGLGFWLGTPDGTYGNVTQQAVMAFQKSTGLGRDGIAGPKTIAALASGARVQPRVATDGVEIDLARQLLIVVSGGTTKWVINTSSGRPGWATPPGTFVVQRAIDGVRHAPLGDLYRPRYFHGGIAVHGSGSIPGYPASHGCTRVSNAAIDMLWSSNALALGTPVRVY